MTLLYLVAAWVSGIFLAAQSPTRASVGVELALAGAALGLAYAVRRRRAWRLTLVCGALLTLGAARTAWAVRLLPPEHIAHLADGRYATLIGVVSQPPDPRESYTGLRVRVESVRTDDAERLTSGDMLVHAPRYERYAYGDRVRVRGQLLLPPSFDDFSYRDYLARRGVYAVVPNARVDVLAHDQGAPWLAALYALRERAQRFIARALPSPQAPLLSGILLGVESAIPADVRDAFNRTGTTHIIAISGANMIVVIRALMGLLTPALGKRRAGWAALAGVALYTLFVGAGAAVVRAAIMGGLAVLAWQLGRRAYGLTTLAFAVWLMSVWSPLVLWDVGFQLSVAATAGLVLFGDALSGALEALLRRGFARETARRLTAWLAEPLTVGLAAQITTTPLILLHFGRLSAVSLLANLLIAPVQPYIMTLGALAVGVGLLWGAAGEVAAWGVWLPLSYTLAVVRRLAMLRWASLQVAFPASSTWTVYAGLLVLGWLAVQHPDDRAAWLRALRRRLSTATLLSFGAALSVLVWYAALHQPDGRLHVRFLDVGQGHAVLFQTPNGAHILIDGGAAPNTLRRAVGDALPFWERSLALVIVTQPKRSAIYALPALLTRYRVGAALTNGHAAESDAYAALSEAWARAGVPVQTLTAGARVQTDDGVTLEVLHPQSVPSAEDDPDTVGMVLRVRYGEVTFLLTPEINAEAEEAMLAAGWYVGSAVLELPAHGKAVANPPEFLAAVRPQVGVVGVAAGNRAGLPEQETVHAVEQMTSRPLYRTDRHGTVEMITDGHTLWVYPER